MRVDFFISSICKYVFHTSGDEGAWCNDDGNTERQSPIFDFFVCCLLKDLQN
jgi:hypothetical protein